MKRKQITILIDIVCLRYDLREIVAFSFFTTKKKSIFRPFYHLFFFIVLLFYSLTLENLEINPRKNLFITHKKRRVGPLNLDRLCQNILIIDPNRLARKRREYKAIHYNLRKPEAKKLIVKHLFYDEIKEAVIKVIFANRGIPYVDGNSYETHPYISRKFFEIDKSMTASFSVYDDKGNLIATSIGFFTQDIFNIEFLVSVYGKYSQVARWVLHEAIVDFVHDRGYKYIRISNYFTTSIKNIYFNRRLGYKDYNLR